MDKIQAKERIDRLRRELDKHNYQYYVADNPMITDAEYDRLFDELSELESRFPEFDDPNSPTHRVGASPIESLETVEHPMQLRSLDKVKSYNQFLSFHNRVAKIADQESLFDVTEYSCTPKLDGLSIRLRYENGELKLGATRGNGSRGENVTAGVRTIVNLPHYLQSDARQCPVLEFRGEVIIHRDDFVKLNYKLEKAGEKTFVSPRNAASGSLRQLDPAITAKRPLRIYLYEILYAENVNFTHHYDQFEYMSKAGLPLVPEHRLCKSIHEVKQYFEYIEHIRPDFSLEMDGVVIKVNDVAIQEEMGSVSHHPRWAVAWKFAAEMTMSHLVGVDWNVTRNGYVTPTGVIEPVFVAGATISRASLHNEYQIARLGIKIGDMVKVRRAGDVIPEIVGPVKEKRDGLETDIEPPTHCPVCGVKLSKPEGEIYRRCPNLACPAVVTDSIRHFVSKSAFDIEGLGEKQIQAMLNADIIDDAADLFSMETEELVKLEGWGEKLASKILANIKSSREILFRRYLYALGIPGVGSHIAGILAREFDCLQELGETSREQLEEIHEIGPAIAGAITDFFAEERNRAYMDKLHDNGVMIKYDSAVKVSGKLNGKKFVLTGAMEKFSRDEAKRQIELHGGQVIGSVSKKTDYVVAGENPGLKLDKAKDLGIMVLTENEFVDMINSPGKTPDEDVT